MSQNAPKIHTVKSYTNDNIELCLEEIKKGRMSCYSASKRYGIPMSTLRYRLSARWKRSFTPGPATRISTMEEQEIVDWLLDMQSRGFIITRAECVSKVSHYMMSVGRETAFKNNKPGRKWCDLFLRRNTNLTLSKTISTPSVQYVRNWFRAVESWCTKTDNRELLEDPARIYILEEIPLTFPLGSSSHSNSAENASTDISVMFAFGASGTTVPPNIIIPAYHAPQDMKMHNLPLGWGMEICEQAYTNTQNFRNYIMNVFHPFLVKQGVRFPVMFFVDGHALPNLAEVEDLCESLGIFLVSPYRTTNYKTVTQSAGLGIAKVMKAKWQKTLEKWFLGNPESMHTLPYFGSILQKTIERGITASEIHDGFRTCGLYPFNVESIDYSGFCFQTAETITQQEESLSNDPLDIPAISEQEFEHAPVLEPELTFGHVSISIDKVYEAYDLIDSHTKARIQGDIRGLTREERIIRFFYREFVQPNVHFNDDPSEDYAPKKEFLFEELQVVKSEPADPHCGDEQSETMAELPGSAVHTEEAYSENQPNGQNIVEHMNKNNEPTSIHVRMFCRMCGIQHQNDQRYSYRELQNEVRALMQFCFLEYAELGPADSLCSGCYQKIDTFRAFAQKCHESQRKLFHTITTTKNVEGSSKRSISTVQSQKWRCQQCGKRYDTQYDLHQHYVNDHGEMSYSCDICGAILKTKMTLYQHRRMIHNKLKKCPYCSKRFTTGKMFEKHVQGHLSDEAGEAASSHQRANDNDTYATSGTSFSTDLQNIIKIEQSEYDDEGGFSETMN